jgi:hypothetical protein
MALDNSVLAGKTKAKKKKVIHLNPANKGKLHKALGEKPGKKLTVAEEEKAKHSSDPAERKEATFALNARKWKK